MACVSRVAVRTGGGWRDGEPVVVMLGDGDPVELGGSGGLSLAVIEQVLALPVESSWEARGRAYKYTLAVGGSELLAFHWHPPGPNGVRTPHLHVGAEIRIGDRWLAKAHLPTGVVALADVLALALGELGVRPLCDDWRTVLGQAGPR
jgi:hypothetical protein